MESNIFFVVFGFACLTQSSSFMPNSQSPGADNSWTHASITRTALFQASVNYLVKNGLIANDDRGNYEKLKAFFNKDSDGFERFENTIQDITRECNKVQQERANEALVSFNGEEIKAGHFHLVTLRKMIDEELAKSKPDLDILKPWIGQYLFTLQSFYSNTNWVEMNGRRINEDIGIFNRSDKIEFAGFLSLTCINKDYSVESIARRSCENNIIVKDKLTSGYKSGQDIKKPIGNQGNSGKCSHGGELDSSRTKTATCGINKDTTSPRYSPHWFLHHEAALGARTATEHFFTQKDSVSQSNNEDFLFQNLFGLKTRNPICLTFVIDISTSMGDEIKELTKWTVDKVSSVIGSPLEPAKYVLVTFSDPVIYTKAFVTEDGQEMVNKLQALSLVGGGNDCPELTFSGLRKAVELSLEGSTVFCFTDADSKDNHLRQTVEKNALMKNISIVFELFGSCRRRKRSQSEYNHILDTEARTKRRISSVFNEVALATGGKVVSVTLKNFASVMNQEFMEKFPSAEVSVDFFTLNSSNTVDFYVDNNLRSLRINITGKENTDEVYIISSSGERFNIDSGNTVQNARILSYGKQKILTKQAPLTGRWRFVCNHGCRALDVNITGQSNVDFTFSLMQPNSEGYMYESVGNPVISQSYTTVIKVFGLNITETDAKLRLIDEEGQMIEEYKLEINSDVDGTSSQYYTSVTMLQKKFAFQLITQDELGNTLTRIKWVYINPVNIRLHLIPIYDMLVDGVEKNVSFRIYNLGKVAQTLVSELQISSGYIVSSATRHHNVEAGTVIEDYFTISTDIFSSDIIIYNIQVQLSGFQEILQSLSGRLKVTNIKHPVCHVVFSEGSCQNVTRTNCIEHKWSAVTETVYSGIDISSLTLIRTGPHIIMTRGDSLNGALQVNISGNCCDSYNRLEILDTDGYMAKCDLLFSSDVKLVIEENSKEQDSDIVPIVLISLGVIFAFILLSIALVIFIKRRNNTFHVS